MIVNVEPTTATVPVLFAECARLGVPYVGFSVSHCRDALLRIRDGATLRLPELSEPDWHGVWIGTDKRLGILNTGKDAK